MKRIHKLNNIRLFKKTKAKASRKAEYQDSGPEETRPQVWSKEVYKIPVQKRQDPKWSKEVYKIPVQKRQDPEWSKRFIKIPVQKRQDPKWSKRFITTPVQKRQDPKWSWRCITNTPVQQNEKESGLGGIFFYQQRYLYQAIECKNDWNGNWIHTSKRRRHLRGLYPSLYSTVTLLDGSGRA